MLGQELCVLCASAFLPFHWYANLGIVDSPFERFEDSDDEGVRLAACEDLKRGDVEIAKGMLEQELCVLSASAFLPHYYGSLY
ncbi:MAG TPA: hypothetical protein DDW52_07600 [Planctomycetaceae bacterium]|nr:hypothetical protein [Planctomycetaceae bacterium]